MIRKLLICPWFGPLPGWFDQYLANVEQSLRPLGYDFLITTNLKGFKERVKRTLDLECPIVPGTGKVHDYRPALGVLFEEEIKGYDFWGFTDFDCIYGRVDKWVTDDFLDSLDIHSNHHSYICGPWTLFRNIPGVNEAFTLHGDWKNIMRREESTGWAETSYSRVLESLNTSGQIKLQYTFWQAKERNPNNLRFENGILLEGFEEIMMHHFRDTKAWPKGCEQ